MYTDERLQVPLLPFPNTVAESKPFSQRSHIWQPRLSLPGRSIWFLTPRILIFVGICLVWSHLYVSPAAPGPDLDLNAPPLYADLIDFQAHLPQHNLSLPFPEGASGRYVKFSSQAHEVGWNNVLTDIALLAFLAYKSQRAYVFQDYVWAPSHYPWVVDKTLEREAPPRTPLGALIGGPITGAPWPPGDNSTPRSIHESHWHIVCPKERVKQIWTHEVKREHALHSASGKQVFGWLMSLSSKCKWPTNSTALCWMLVSASSETVTVGHTGFLHTALTATDGRVSVLGL
ncbi:hypothetical protein D9611_007178 [Ephemerocybe angulata]|uniref:Uncharacterized protein n=1 Tax=Ephemerocybe angulata TaxID=980116 RepID=A0A8H5EWN1_9AGAR|nr:hypothetical protein D9611_007178 [Tulosesus angulatus]